MAEEKKTLELCGIDCEGLSECGVPNPDAYSADRRTLKSTTAISLALRGETVSSKRGLPNPMQGIVMGRTPVTVPQPRNVIDRMRYAAAQRPSFEVYNYVYKVLTPAIAGTSWCPFTGCEDLTKKDTFIKGVSSMPDVGVAMGVTGGDKPIAAGTWVMVKFAGGNTPNLSSGQIIEIGDALPLPFTSMFPRKTGDLFKLGKPGVNTGGAPDTSWYHDSSEEEYIAPPENSNIDPDDDSLIIGTGPYAQHKFKKRIAYMERHMKEAGITNRFMRIALLAVTAKESNMGRKMVEGSWAGVGGRPIKRKFGDKAGYKSGQNFPGGPKFTEAELAELANSDVDFFSHIYGVKNASKWAKHKTDLDGFNFRGRGWNGITYKALYARVGGSELVGNPDLLGTKDPSDETHEYAAKIAVTLFKASLMGDERGREFNNVTSQQEANILGAASNAGWGKLNEMGKAISDSINSVNKTSHWFE